MDKANNENRTSEDSDAPSTSKKKTNELQNDKQVIIDEMLCKFFAKTGLPSDTVRDPSFIQLIYILNKDYSPPTPSTVDYELEAITNKMMLDKGTIDLIEVNRPISITVDIIKKTYDVFLAFSLHYFNDDGPRKNVVHLRKMKTADIVPKVILEEIAKANNKNSVKFLRVPSLVTSNTELAHYFEEVNGIDRSYLCYYSQITAFADAILKIPDVVIALDALKKFYLGVKTDYLFQCRIEKYFLSKKVLFDLPNNELLNWTDVSEFLSNVLQYHRLIVDLSRSFLATNPRYIDENLYEQLMYLQNILSHLNKSVKDLSQSDSFASDILPEIVQIRKLFITTDINNVISDQVIKEFMKHLGRLIYNDPKTDYYKIATFLDPRYSFDTEIFDLGVWQSFVDHTRISFLSSELESSVSTNERKYRIMSELMTFRRLVKSHRPSSNPFAWWKIHAKQLPSLYDAARTFISPPPCAIDSQQYFGDCGKFVMNNRKMTLKQFNNTLAVASSLEIFRGRGWTDKHIKLESIAINRGSPVNVTKSIKKKKSNHVRKRKVTTSTTKASTESAERDNAQSTSSIFSDMMNPVKEEPVDPDESVFDISNYYMQAPEVKEEPIETEISDDIILNPEEKPQNLLLESMEVESESGALISEVKAEHDEMSETSPSTSTTTQKLIYVSKLTENKEVSKGETKKIIIEPVDRRVFIRVPYQRTEMERVLRTASDESSTFTSINNVSPRFAKINPFKRPAETKSPPLPYVLEGGCKKICTNIETNTGVIVKERLFSRSTPANLTSVTMKMAPQKIRFDSVPKTTTPSTSKNDIEDHQSTSEELHVKKES